MSDLLCLSQDDADDCGLESLRHAAAAYYEVSPDDLSVADLEYFDSNV